MNIRQLENIIDRYLAGIATETEKDFIQQWLYQKDVPTGNLGKEKRNTLAAELWLQISDQAGIYKNRKIKSYPTPVFSLYNRFFRYVAAAFIILTGTTIIYLLASRNRKPAVTYSSIVSAAGQQRLYILPDSSRVYLFPNSSLQVPDNYGKKGREILLKGRGFFEVRQDATRPFYVHAGSLHTRVLGTSFEVNVADSNHATVIVRTGKVGIQYNDRDLAILTPDKRLQYDALQLNAKIDDVDAGLLCEWWKGELAFQQTPLPDAIRAVSDWYNIPIHIENKQWLSETVTIRFKDQTITEVMNLLSKTIGFSYRIQQQGIVIY